MDGDDLHVAAPHLHFLTGKPLERLKDGAAVVFLTQLTLTTDNSRTSAAPAPSASSSATICGRRSSRSRSWAGAAHGRVDLSASAAEAWCLDNLAISTSGLPPDRPFWLRFELRAADPKDEAAVIGDAGLESDAADRNLQPPATRSAAQWTADAGPLRLGRSQEARRAAPRERVNRLRNRLILIFLAATLAPLAATLWITTSLLDAA